MKMILEAAKVLVSVSVLLCANGQAFGDVPAAEERESIVHHSQTTLNVDLNPQTVICSQADYSMPMLKVLVPGLAGITLLDHQNQGAGAPCMTTGQRCSRRAGDKGALPADILQGNPRIEKAEVSVTAIRVEEIDHATKTCTTYLKEHVETMIGGKRFFHERTASLGTRSYVDCLSTPSVP